MVTKLSFPRVDIGSKKRNKKLHITYEIVPTEDVDERLDILPLAEWDLLSG